jgi:hypothetical protein
MSANNGQDSKRYRAPLKWFIDRIVMNASEQYLLMNMGLRRQAFSMPSSERLAW